MLKHNLKDPKTKYIKNIQTENEAILAHCQTNIDKYEADQELIKNSKPGLIKTYYIANEDFNLFIYGDIKDDIIEKIKFFVLNQTGGGSYYKYKKYKNKYLILKQKVGKL